MMPSQRQQNQEFWNDGTLSMCTQGLGSPAPEVRSTHLTALALETPTAISLWGVLSWVFYRFQ